MTAKAILRNYRQSPRKVRLVADLIRGKKVNSAFVTLRFLDKKASDPINTLLRSAQSNAKNLDLSDDLFIKEITVNEGPILYRRRARARGRAMPIRKRSSHVAITLAEVGSEDGSKSSSGKIKTKSVDSNEVEEKTKTKTKGGTLKKDAPEKVNK